MVKQKAFSLVELMVVIAIIGILATIAVPSYKTYVLKAKVVNGLSVLDMLSEKIVDKYTKGENWHSALSLLNSSTFSGIGSVRAGQTTIATCAVGTSYAAAGLYFEYTSSLNIGKVICINNDIITYTCGYISGGFDPNNKKYLPSNCQQELLATGL